jgi:hypothetical protein
MGMMSNLVEVGHIGLARVKLIMVMKRRDFDHVMTEKSVNASHWIASYRGLSVSYNIPVARRKSVKRNARAEWTLHAYLPFRTQKPILVL